MMPEEENKLSSPANESPPDSSSLSANDNGKQASSTDFGQEALFDESNQSFPKFLPQIPQTTAIVSSSVHEKSASELLLEAKDRTRLKRIERQEQLQAANDWIGFVTTKTVGIGALVVGGIQIVLPGLLTISLTPPFTPFTLVGIGLALLTGQKSISLIKIVLEALAKESKEDDQ